MLHGGQVECKAGRSLLHVSSITKIALVKQPGLAQSASALEMCAYHTAARQTRSAAAGMTQRQQPFNAWHEA